MSKKKNQSKKKAIKPIGKYSTTNRGFGLVEFRDLYGDACSIQESSLATQDALWIGIDDPKPQIMARDAAAHGITTLETSGFIPYPLPREVVLTTRMHLNRAQVEALKARLELWLETGRLETDDAS